MQPIKPIRIDLPSDIESVELHPLADLHIGDAMSDWELIQSEIKRVLETPNAYCVLNGDLMDTAIASSIGDTYLISPFLTRGAGNCPSTLKSTV